MSFTGLCMAGGPSVPVTVSSGITRLALVLHSACLSWTHTSASYEVRPSRGLPPGGGLHTAAWSSGQDREPSRHWGFCLKLSVQEIALVGDPIVTHKRHLEFHKIHRFIAPLKQTVERAQEFTREIMGGVYIFGIIWKSFPSHTGPSLLVPPWNSWCLGREESQCLQAGRLGVVSARRARDQSSLHTLPDLPSATPRVP